MNVILLVMECNYIHLLKTCTQQFWGNCTSIFPFSGTLYFHSTTFGRPIFYFYLIAVSPFFAWPPRLLELSSVAPSVRPGAVHEQKCDWPLVLARCWFWLITRGLTQFLSLVRAAKWLAAVPLSAHLPLLPLSLIVFPPRNQIRCWSVVCAAFPVFLRG